MEITYSKFKVAFYNYNKSKTYIPFEKGKHTQSPTSGPFQPANKNTTFSAVGRVVS